MVVVVDVRLRFGIHELVVLVPFWEVSDVNGTQGRPNQKKRKKEKKPTFSLVHHIYPEQSPASSLTQSIRCCFWPVLFARRIDVRKGSIGQEGWLGFETTATWGIPMPVAATSSRVGLGRLSI